MPAPYTTARRIEFCDTDAAGIVHFSAFFLYMEQTEHELLRHLGTSVMRYDEQGLISWPRVSASCDYSGTAQFEDVLDIELSVARLGSKSVTYTYRFFRKQLQIAQGTMTAVCCRIAGDRPQSIPIPAELRQQLADYQVSS